MASTPVTIDVFSDVVCPWCYLGKRRLDEALEMREAGDVLVRWRAYQLDPTIPAEGLDRTDYLVRKFGSLDAVRPSHERLEALGAEEGIGFSFDAIRRSPNTLDAHRLIRLAGESGAGIQAAVVEELFSRYFTAGEDLGDRTVLVDVAETCGLDPEAARAALAGDAGREAVRAEVDFARARGIDGVPCFIFGERFALFGAQPVELLLEGIRKAREEAAPQ